MIRKAIIVMLTLGAVVGAAITMIDLATVFCPFLLE